MKKAALRNLRLLVSWSAARVALHLVAPGCIIYYFFKKKDTVQPYVLGWVLGTDSQVRQSQIY